MFSILNISTSLFCILATVVYGQEEAPKKYEDLCIGNKEEMKHVIVPGKGCKLFVICNMEYMHGPLQCPPTTKFSMDRLYCDDENNVTCVDTSDRLLDEPDCTMKAVPGYCKNFTVCSNGQLVMQHCNVGLVFSNTKLVCDYERDLSPEDKAYCKIDD